MAAGPARLRIEPESNFGNSICGNLSAPALNTLNGEKSATHLQHLMSSDIKLCWEILATLPKRRSHFLVRICAGWPINSESVRNIWDQYVEGSLVMWLYAMVLSTTGSTFLCAQGSMVKDVLQGRKGLTSNPGTSAFRNTKPYETLMESCVVTDFWSKYAAFIGPSSSWWNVISSLFLARCTHGNETAIGNSLMRSEVGSLGIGATSAHSQAAFRGCSWWLHSFRYFSWNHQKLIQFPF